MGCQQDGSVSLHHADRDGHQRPHLLEPAGARLCRRARRPERQRPRPARCRGDARIATRVRGITAGRQLPALAAPRRSAPPSSRPGMRSRMATSGGCSASTWCWRGCRSSCLHSPTCSPPPPGERLGRGGIDSSRNPSPDLLPPSGAEGPEHEPKVRRRRRDPSGPAWPGLLHCNQRGNASPKSLPCHGRPAVEACQNACGTAVSATRRRGEGSLGRESAAGNRGLPA
jgi:hypothetical protein